MTKSKDDSRFGPRINLAPEIIPDASRMTNLSGPSRETKLGDELSEYGEMSDSAMTSDDNELDLSKMGIRSKARQRR